MTENVRQRKTITGEYDRIKNNIFRSYSPVQVRRFNEFISFLLHFYFFGQIHRFFGQVQQLMFVGVIFRSCSIVHIRRCEFYLVIFQHIFRHIELVKITCLFFNVMK